MRVTLHFNLAEDVTPSIFAQRVAQACAAQGALRTGESVSTGNLRYEVVDRPDFAISLFVDSDA